MSTMGTLSGGRGSNVGRGAIVILLAVVAFALTSLMAPASATSDVATGRITGANRYETAARVAGGAFPSGATNAIVASGTNFPDALSASYLAGALGAPILYTDPATLSPDTYNALLALGTRSVTVVGGAGAVSENVVQQLASIPSPAGGTLAVARIGGVDRFETNRRIVAQPGTTRVGSVAGARTALVASGAAFPDALAAGPMAFSNGLPILLTSPTSLSPSVPRSIQDLGIARVVILGGEGAVSSAVATQLAGYADVQRIAGVDRFDTSSKVARFEIDALGFSNTQLLLTSGLQFPDALAAGPLGGVAHIPVLLAFGDGLREATQAHLDAYKDTLVALLALGGTGAISDADLAAAAYWAGRGRTFTPGSTTSSTSSSSTGGLPHTT
jgi:putative cell wall-binding protein